MLASLIDWVLRHLPVVVFVIVVIAQALRAAKKAQSEAAGRKAPSDALEDERRVREVREKVRRLAERRADGAPSLQTAEPPPARKAPVSETTQLPDIFDGPLGRMLGELQKRVEPPPEPLPPPVLEVRNTAELERQQRLADELKALEEARAVAKHRAAAIAARKEAAAPASVFSGRDRLLQDLRDPQNLRRSVVLSEVLGPPLALR